MKKLNREKVIRMVGGEINNRIGISSSGGSGGGGLAGAATQAWVDANYVSIEFFDRLFQAYSGTGSSATRVNANDTESTIDNIKAMFGFWTEQYLSTLGQGSGGGGGGGAEALSDLLDVELTTLQNGQALIYSSAIGKWTNGTAGVNMTQVWSALDSATNEQINASHLSTALSGYVNTSAISDMATKTWVSQQGYATQTWVGQNYISIAFFDRLFQAYNGTGSSATRVNPNDTTSTIDNIKAMFGFWTEFYLSALGDGSASSGSISLGMLSDVSLSSPTDGQALVFDATLGIWKNGTITSGVSSLSALSDVQLTAPATNQVLMYDSSTTKWYNSDLKTINGQSIYGSGDISVGGGASGNYLPLSGGTLTGRLTINYDPRLSPSSFYIRSETVNTGLGFGNSETSKNSVYLKFKSTSYNSGSTANRFAVDFYGNDNVFNILADGKVGIGTTTPDTRLKITGSSTDSGILLCLDSPDKYDCYSEFRLSGGVSAQVGYSHGAAFLSNQKSNGKRLCIDDSGNPQYWTAWNGTKYNLWHSGNFAPSNYLPLTGGTLTGNLTISNNNPYVTFSESGYNWIVQAYNAKFYFGIGINYSIIMNTDGHIGIGGEEPSLGYDLVSKGDMYCKGTLLARAFNAAYVEIPAGQNIIQSTSGYDLYVNFSRNDNVLLCIGGGNVGIGVSTVSYKLQVAGSIYATGGVTALSDIRHKTVIRDAAVSVEDIARMPAVMYQWNDGREDKELHVGSIAQNWQTVLPEVVLRANDKEGTLSMQYGVAALVSSIIIARKVVNHEDRIEQLEKENKELKMKLKIA